MTNTFEVRDPATTEVIAQVPDGNATDATAAVDAASSAFPAWSATPPRQRAEALRKAYELMVADADRLAAIMTSENGKTDADARAEVAYAADFFRWYSEEAVRSDGDYGISPAGGTRSIVTQRPVGVAALVTPWNFPAAMATRKLGPALAAGCTTVLKPASETPLTALAIGEILVQAGIPADAVRIVTSTRSSEIVSTWLDDARVRKVSFTGSTRVGGLLLGQAAERIVNASMELGGNAPFIVTADADLDTALSAAMVAKFRNAGQACTAANRFLVHADIADRFVTGLVERIRTAEIAPLINEAAVEKVATLVEEAVTDGAHISHQGTVPDTGWRYPATVVTEVSPQMRITREEIFGPVVAVQTWTDRDEMLTNANDTDYGLAAYVQAGRLQDGLKIAESLDVGMVGVNRGAVSDPAAPFGGTKHSGIGREGARDGIRAFTETQFFSVDWS